MPKKLKPDVVMKYNPKVDTGPLPQADKATRQTIQNERIRRQRTSNIKPSARGKKP